MAHRYAEIAFTKEVRKVQEEQNSRDAYANMDEGEDYNYLLSEREAEFISTRDSFYMASVSETQWPYVQHRGGPKGFLKVIDEKTLGFADFKGNRQYMSTGNFRNNDRVSLILMDYPSRTRLKVLGRVSTIPDDDLETLVQLEDPSYRARVERGFIIHIEAFDWNCPQHITPRYTENEIDALVAPLKQENEILKSQLSALENRPSAEHSPKYKADKELGTGPLKLTISGIRQLSPRVRAFELRHPEGKELPKVEAASHIQVPILLEDGQLDFRLYSICSNPKRRDIYEIAVQLDPEGKGGSKAVHAQYQLGTHINCEYPKNNFKLHTDDRPSILIAGGIGITPIKAMAQALKCRHILKQTNLVQYTEQANFSIHYTGRSESEMPFLDRMQREFKHQLNVYTSGNKTTTHAMDVSQILRNASDNAIFYICGPSTLIDAVRDEAAKQGIDPERIRFERFQAKLNNDTRPVELILKKSNRTINVHSEISLLDALLDNDINVAYSCKTGDCKSCAVKVLDGEVTHHDNALSEAEKSKDKLMCPCVSRASSSTLTLDI